MSGGGATSQADVARRVMFARVVLVGAGGVAVMPVLAGDPQWPVVAVLSAVAFIALAAVLRWTAIPFTIVGPVLYATGLACHLRPVLVAATPDMAAFHAIGSFVVLLLCAFFIWRGWTAAVVSALTGVGMAAIVLLQGAPTGAATMLAYTAGAVVLMQARSATIQEVDAQRDLALSDPLTGLPNRRAMLLHLRASMVRQAEGAPTEWVVLFDLDHFKQLNDTEGHQAGDDALAAIGPAAEAVLGADDVLGRWGGEEFLVLTSGHGPTVAERLRRAIARGTPVTASFGVASATDGATVERWLSAADRAMYAAKQAGRDRVALTEDDCPRTVRVA